MGTKEQASARRFPKRPAVATLASEVARMSFRKVGAALALVVGIAPLGCSGAAVETTPPLGAAKQPATSGSGGSGGSGGAPDSMSFGGGGEAPVPAARGAYNVHFVGGGPAGCNIGGHFGALGVVSADKHGAVVTDGVDGAAVSCGVSGAGPYKVSGTITQGANSLFVEVDSLPADASAAIPAYGRVSFTSPVTGDAFVQSNADPSVQPQPCDFYFVAGSSELAAPGKVWLAFTCATVSDGANACQLYTSYVLIEDCQSSS